jgi:hypothetical protein
MKTIQVNVTNNTVTEEKFTWMLKNMYVVQILDPQVQQYIVNVVLTVHLQVE